jgi:hypothetical protein
MVEMKRCGHADASQRSSGGLNLPQPQAKKYRHGTNLAPPVNAVFTDLAALLAVLKQHVPAIICAPMTKSAITTRFWVSPCLEIPDSAVYTGPKG